MSVSSTRNSQNPYAASAADPSKKSSTPPNTSLSERVSQVSQSSLSRPSQHVTAQKVDISLKDIPILREIEKMLKSSTAYETGAYFEAFQILSRETQVLIYRLLCAQEDGSKVIPNSSDGIIMRGIDIFLGNPSSLNKVIDQLLPLPSAKRISAPIASSPCTNSSAYGSSSRVTGSNTRNAPVRRNCPPSSKPVHTDVAPYVMPWEDGVSLLSKEEICDSLDRLMQSWYTNQSEEQDRGQKSEEERKKELRDLNKQIFLHMKKTHGIMQTPMDFLLSLHGHRLEPIPIITNPKKFVPEEGQFYKMDSYDKKESLEKHEQFEGNAYFTSALKRTGNELYLYLDGRSQGGYFLINRQIYPWAGSDRGGCSKPSYRFKEGDVVSDGIAGYLFTVGENGTILFPPGERQGYEEDTKQTKRFIEGNVSKGPLQLTYTTKEKYATEIVEPFEPGFVLYSGDEKRESDRIIIDIEKDPILQSVIEYLRAEFTAMNYTDTQKMMRIAHFSADILNENPHARMKYNYMLGEFLKAGGSVCRHRAILIKVLSNALLPDIACVLVTGSVFKYIGNGQWISGDTSFATARHAWNVMKIDGRNYIVDAMQECLFDAGNPPGKEINSRGENIGQKFMLGYYGAECLGVSPFRLCIIEDDEVMRDHAIQAARKKFEQGGYGRVLKLEIKAPTTYRELEEILPEIQRGDFHFVLVDNDLTQYPDCKHNKDSENKGIALINGLIKQANSEGDAGRPLQYRTQFYPNSSNNSSMKRSSENIILSWYNRTSEQKNGSEVVRQFGLAFSDQARKRYSKFQPHQSDGDTLTPPERPKSPF